MLNVNSLIFICVIILSALLYTNHCGRSNYIERFGLPAMSRRIERVVSTPSEMAKGNFYSVPGNYQALLTPRFSPSSLAQAVSFKVPENKMMAISNEPVTKTPKCDPVTFGKMVKEDYNSCRPAQPIDETPKALQSMAASNQPITSENAQDSQYPLVSDMIPVNDMSNINTVSAGDNDESLSNEPIIYDRVIYSNRNSRLRSQGDPIRGDLPIVPCNADWFKPNVNPSTDLQIGAMNVMGGNNETSNELMTLINLTSGGNTNSSNMTSSAFMYNTEPEVQSKYQVSSFV